MSCNCKMDFIRDVSSDLIAEFCEDDLKKIIDTITIKLNEYKMSERCTALTVVDTESQKLVKKFLATKRIEGRSQKTIDRYSYVIKRMMEYLNMPIKDMDVYSLRLYLAEMEMNGSKDSTLNGIRWIMCSFFGWLHDEGFIEKNPTANLGKIKCKKEIRKPFSKVEIEKIKNICGNERDRAIVEFLLSTGCRVSELVGVDRSDINFQSQECKILGKGNKERIVFLNDVCLLHIKSYLDSRSDDLPALFIGKGSDRMTTGGIRFMLNNIAEKAGVEDVHPHRFRRTVATYLIDRGMSVQDLAVILGHSNINTTMAYVYSDIENVKTAYKKYAI